MFSFLKTPKTKALFRTIFIFFGLVILIEFASWLVLNFGKEILSAAIIGGSVWFMYSVYEDSLAKYNKQNEDEDASN